jgi:hypothetical protein
VRASYNDETGLIVKQLTSLGLKKIAVFYQNDAYGKAGLDGVVLALAAQNLKPVAQATVERNTVDVAAAVKTLVAAGPDAVVQIGAYKACAAFIREARKAGYGGTFYNVSFVGTQALADELGKDGAGVVVSQVMPSPYNTARPIAREFVDAVKAAGKDAKANFSSMEGYVAAKVLVDGLKRGGAKMSRESLIAGLEAMGSQSLGGFRVLLADRPRGVELRGAVDADRRRPSQDLIPRALRIPQVKTPDSVRRFYLGVWSVRRSVFVAIRPCMKAWQRASCSRLTNSSGWCAWVMLPGPHTTVGMPAPLKMPASVPKATSVVSRCRPGAAPGGSRRRRPSPGRPAPRKSFQS